MIRQLTGPQHNQVGLGERILTELAAKLSVGGPCTVIWMNRFFSDRVNNKPGKAREWRHINNPTPWLAKAWELHIKRSDSIIEQSIYEKKGHVAVGVATLAELFQDAGWKAKWQSSAIRLLAVAARIRDIAYVWIRLSEEDMWIFCLRRKRYEGYFTNQECAFLQVFGEELLRLRRYWYLAEVKMLTARQQQIFSMHQQGMTVNEICEIIGRHRRTVENCLRQVEEKIDDFPSWKNIPDSLWFTTEDLQDISEQGMRVLRLYSQGMTIEEVAMELNISKDAVKAHNRRIFRKLKVKNR